MAYKNKEDQARAAKAHYQANKAGYVARAKESKAQNRAKIHSHIADHLAANACVDCGEKDPIVLEFDHQPGAEKRFNLGDAVKRGFSLNSVIAEIAKCVVRCANCHRRKTYRERLYSHRG